MIAIVERTRDYQLRREPPPGGIPSRELPPFIQPQGVGIVLMVAKVMGTQVEALALASALAEAFDLLRAAMFLVDRSGRIVHANVAGHSMMAKGDILCAISGRILIREARSNHQLSGIFAAAGDGDAALGTAGITLLLNARSGQQYVAHVLPLTSGLRNHAAKTYSAVAALFVQSVAPALPSALETIAKVFRLTPTELNVLLAIVEVGGAPEVAELLGIAVSTVKTHLARVYYKTGTKRHVDLAKLVAGYANPLIDRDVGLGPGKPRSAQRPCSASVR